MKEPSNFVLSEHGGLHASTSHPDGDDGIVVCLRRKVLEVVPSIVVQKAPTEHLLLAVCRKAEAFARLA